MDIISIMLWGFLGGCLLRVAIEMANSGNKPKNKEPPKADPKK